MNQFEQMMYVGVIMSIVLSVMILGSLYYNPRLSLTDYPKDIQKVVFPKSIHEKSKPFTLILYIMLFFSVVLSFLHIYYISMKNYCILMLIYTLLVF